MRTIKFRAWSLKHKEMTNTFDMHHVPVGVLTASIDPVIMQWTGLHDSEGNEIYENDIVEHRDTFGGKETSQKFTVRWASNGRFFYESDEDPEYDGLLGITPVKVIGNTFEHNPEVSPCTSKPNPKESKSAT